MNTTEQIDICRTSAGSHDVIEREQPLPIPGREEVEEVEEGQVHLQPAGTGAIDFFPGRERRCAEFSECQQS